MQPPTVDVHRLIDFHNLVGQGEAGLGLQHFKVITEEKTHLHIHSLFFFPTRGTGNPSLDYVHEATPPEMSRPCRTEPKHTRGKKLSEENHPFLCHLLSSQHLCGPSPVFILTPSLCLPSSPSGFHSDHFPPCRDPHISSHSPLIPIKTYMLTSQSGWGLSGPLCRWEMPRR